MACSVIYFVLLGWPGKKFLICFSAGLYSEIRWKSLCISLVYMLHYELMKWFTMFISWSDLLVYIIWKCKMNRRKKPKISLFWTQFNKLYILWICLNIDRYFGHICHLLWKFFFFLISCVFFCVYVMGLFLLSLLCCLTDFLFLKTTLVSLS